MSDESDNVERQAEALLAFKKRLIAEVLDSVEDVPSEEQLEEQRRDIEMALNLSENIDYLFALVLDSVSDNDKATSVAVLNLALLQTRVLILSIHKSSPEDTVLVEQMRKQAEHARKFIKSMPAIFYDEIVEQVFKEHIEGHGPWRGHPMPLARKLKPEIDRRAVAGDGKPLEPDTIARRLKVLMAPTQH